MKKIQIVCPSCRTRLTFPEVPGYEEKILECPACHFKAKVVNYQGGSLNQGGNGADDAPTEINVPEGRKNTDPGQIRVMSTGQTCELQIGSLVIGRVAKSGTADIQITDDPYMSRRHVQIDVIRSAQGLQHRLVEIGCKNTPKVNGNSIRPGDIIPLKFGDIITMGRSEIRLEESDEEATRVEI